MRKRKYSSLPTTDRRLMEDGAPLPTVHNIVATSQILSSLPLLDLNKIHDMLPFSFYDQHKFAAITVRLHEPDCTTLLFSSGKLVVTGCRTWYECVYASLFIAGLLQVLSLFFASTQPAKNTHAPESKKQECIPGFTFTLGTCDVQNMVAHVEIPVGEGCLDLHGMYAQMALNCTYQRKMFPGLIYRPEASPVVLLCFFSGKIVITGGKTMQDVFAGWNRLWPTLLRYIVCQPSDPPTLQQPGSAAHHHHQQGPSKRSKSTRTMSADSREHHERLPLEGHAVARDAPRPEHALVEPAGGDGRGPKTCCLADIPELESLCNDLAAEGGALLL